MNITYKYQKSTGLWEEHYIRLVDGVPIQYMLLNVNNRVWKDYSEDNEGVSHGAVDISEEDMMLELI